MKIFIGKMYDLYPQLAPRKILITMCRNTYFALYIFFTSGRSGHSDSLDSCCNCSRKGKEENSWYHQIDKKKEACERGEDWGNLINLTLRSPFFILVSFSTIKSIQLLFSLWVDTSSGVDFGIIFLLHYKYRHHANLCKSLLNQSEHLWLIKQNT